MIRRAWRAGQVSEGEQERTDAWRAAAAATTATVAMEEQATFG